MALLLNAVAAVSRQLRVVSALAKVAARVSMAEDTAATAAFTVLLVARHTAPRYIPQILGVVVQGVQRGQVPVGMAVG